VLQRRLTLTGVVWLLDVRHSLSVDDQEFQELLSQSGRGVLPVLTKADKIVQSKRASTVASRARELGVAPDEVQLVSARTGHGVTDLAESLIAAAERSETA